MNITIDNGWSGPLPGIARQAGFSLLPDGSTAVLAFAVQDAEGPGPFVGRTIDAKGATWRLIRSVEQWDAPLTFICSKIEEPQNG